MTLTTLAFLLHLRCTEVEELNELIAGDEGVRIVHPRRVQLYDLGIGYPTSWFIKPPPGIH